MRVSTLSRVLWIHPVTTCVAFSASARIVTTTLSAHRHHPGFQQRSSTSLSSIADHKKPQESPTVTANTSKEHHYLLGGEFAGYATQCDVGTGAAKPVPVYLVPPSLLEWGQHPKVLEVIVSEDSTTTNTEQQWNRICLTVLPETGCGVDNLEVQKTTQEGWNVLCLPRADDDDDEDKRNHCISLVRQVSSTSFMMETIFGVTPTAAEHEEEEEEPHRLRVTVTASSEQKKEASIIKDIVLSYERRFDATSTQGTRANGGGLDGASVARWMGPNIAQQGVKLLEAIPSDNNADNDSTNEEGTNNHGSPTNLDLPAGVTLEYKSEGTAAHLRVSHSNGQTMLYKWNMGDPASIQAIPA
mmetsp:Transcript_14180/g.28577  ORF Transcript_14180/g.28577 Transcript_14180/m.28577 type:complete len:357 (-) Transcript_14180:476-1546(-)